MSDENSKALWFLSNISFGVEEGQNDAKAREDTEVSAIPPESRPSENRDSALNSSDRPPQSGDAEYELPAKAANGCTGVSEADVDLKNKRSEADGTSKRGYKGGRPRKKKECNNREEKSLVSSLLQGVSRPSRRSVFDFLKRTATQNDEGAVKTERQGNTKKKETDRGRDAVSKVCKGTYRMAAVGDDDEESMIQDKEQTDRCFDGNRMILKFFGYPMVVTSVNLFDRGTGAHPQGCYMNTIREQDAGGSGGNENNNGKRSKCGGPLKYGASYKHLLYPSSSSAVHNKSVTEAMLADSGPWMPNLYNFYESEAKSEYEICVRSNAPPSMWPSFQLNDFRISSGYVETDLYDPHFLDIDFQRLEKYWIVVNIPYYRSSLISSCSSKKVKAEENQAFRDRHPWLKTDLTLSKIRSTKKKIVQAAIANSLDMACTAFSLAYFERLILKNQVSKLNCRVFSAVCLLLSAKFYGQKNALFASLLKELQLKLDITIKEILSNEFYVYKELGFTLYMEPAEVLPHFIKLQNFQDYLDLEFEEKQKEHDMFHAKQSHRTSIGR